MWRIVKGIPVAWNRCSMCNGLYDDDYYDFKEGACLYCLFPETFALPERLVSEGKLVPEERYVLDNLDKIPSKIKQPKVTQREKQLLKAIRKPKKQLPA